MKKMRRLEWLIVLGMATLGGLVGAQAETLTWSGGATTEGDFDGAGHVVVGKATVVILR